MFQYYRGGKFYLLRKPEYLEKTTDLSQIEDYHRTAVTIQRNDVINRIVKLQMRHFLLKNITIHTREFHNANRTIQIRKLSVLLVEEIGGPGKNY
jgi:hypothetical protein